MRAALYEKDITPPLGCYMAGLYRKVLAEDVLEKLHVKALVIECGGEAVAILEIDLCMYHDDLHDIVTKRIEEYTGIAPKNVLICANHTHKGIPVYDSPEIGAYADAPYTDVVYRLIADCVILAYKRLEDAELFFGKSIAEGIAFNRTFIMKNGEFKTNVQWDKENIAGTLSGVDEEVPVLFIKDKSGVPKGALLSFACHNDVNSAKAYSGGFSSILAKELKKKYGEDFITVFVPGTCGDINHINPNGGTNSETYIKMGMVLADAVEDALLNSKPILAGKISSKKEKIKIPKRKYTKESILENIKDFCDVDNEIAFVRNIVFFEACNNETEREVILQCIKIGDVFIFGYSGEIFVDYGLQLKKVVGSDKIIIATLANRYCGYVPARKAFAEESRLYEKKLCFVSCLAEEAGDMMNEKLIEMSGE